MLVSEFKALPGAPALPPGLPDDALVEDYLIKVFNHASRIERYVNPGGGDRLWKFYIDQDGVIRGEVRVPVSVNVTVQT